METILIKNGIIVNADKTEQKDILIKGGKIEKVGNIKENEAQKVIDASGDYVFPGGIDTHVHFHLPFYGGYTADDFLTGSIAALYGGTTTVIDFITPKRGQSLIEAYEQRVAEAVEVKTNLYFHLTPVDWHKGIEQEIETLVRDYGIRSFKLYMAYKHAIGIDDSLIIKALEIAKKFDLLTIVHCEHDEIINYLRNKFYEEGKRSVYYHALSRPAEAEAEAVQRLILMAKYTGAKVYVVHVSTASAAKLIADARKNGIEIYAETCPQYLLLTDDLYKGDFYSTAKYVMSPPLRKQDDNQALWKHIAENFIDTIGTDHCSFNLYGQKDLGKDDFRKIPNGAPGVEHRLQLLYTYGVLQGRISLNKFVQITSFNAAKLFKLTTKGVIAEGYDADIVIWDKDYKGVISATTQKQNVDNTIYEGMPVEGRAKKVFLGGKLVVDL